MITSDSITLMNCCKVHIYDPVHLHAHVRCMPYSILTPSLVAACYRCYTPPLCPPSHQCRDAPSILRAKHPGVHTPFCTHLLLTPYHPDRPSHSSEDRSSSFSPPVGPRPHPPFPPISPLHPPFNRYLIQTPGASMQGMPIPHLQRVGPITLPSSRLYRFHVLSLGDHPPSHINRSTLAVQADRIVAYGGLLSWPAHRPFMPARTGFDANGRLPSTCEPITRHTRRALPDITSPSLLPLLPPAQQEESASI